jgi:hypothetical protein
MSMAWGRGLSTLGAGAVGMGQTIMQRVKDQQDEERQRTQMGFMQNADARAQQSHELAMRPQQPTFRYTGGDVSAELPMNEQGFAQAAQLGTQFPGRPPAYQPTSREEYLANHGERARIEAEHRAPPEVNWQTVPTGQGYAQVNPRTGASRDLGLQPPPRTGNETAWQTRETAQGLVQINPQTGESRELGLQPPVDPKAAAFGALMDRVNQQPPARGGFRLGGGKPAAQVAPAPPPAQSVQPQQRAPLPPPQPGSGFGIGGGAGPAAPTMTQAPRPQQQQQAPPPVTRTDSLRQQIMNDPALSPTERQDLLRRLGGG